MFTIANRNLLPAALLVFLFAAAGTGVVPAHFGPATDRLGLLDCRSGFADDVAALGRTIPDRLRAAGSRAAEGIGVLLDGALLRVMEVFERHHVRGAAEDVMADLGFDVDHQLFENLEGFGLVFDERIALPMSAQTDAV